MKKWILGLAVFFSMGAAQADSTLLCIAGQIKADGTIGVLSGNDAQIGVIQNGTIAFYTLKDTFSLYKTHYNVKDPFDMSLVVFYGSPSVYTTTDTGYSATWAVKDDGQVKTTATVTVDTTAKTGHIETDKTKDSDGSFTGSSSDNLQCVATGLKQ